eukprot:3263752-Rhodomonas_salina.3
MAPGVASGPGIAHATGREADTWDSKLGLFNQVTQREVEGRQSLAASRAPSALTAPHRKCRSRMPCPVCKASAEAASVPGRRAVHTSRGASSSPVFWELNTWWQSQSSICTRQHPPQHRSHSARAVGGYLIAALVVGVEREEPRVALDRKAWREASVDAVGHVRRALCRQARVQRLVLARAAEQAHDPVELPLAGRLRLLR